MNVSIIIIDFIVVQSNFLRVNCLFISFVFCEVEHVVAL